MLRRLRSLAVIVVAAVAGAVLGRIALEVRQNVEQGAEPAAIDVDRITLRAQDFVPGLVAAFRMNDAPWSWLPVPSWVAAFGVNFGVAAVGGDMTRLREEAERAAFRFAGLDARDFGLGGTYDVADDDASIRHDAGTEWQASSSTAYTSPS